MQIFARFAKVQIISFLEVEISVVQHHFVAVGLVAFEAQGLVEAVGGYACGIGG